MFLRQTRYEYLLWYAETTCFVLRQLKHRLFWFIISRRWLGFLLTNCGQNFRKCCALHNGYFGGGFTLAVATFTFGVTDFDADFPDELIERYSKALAPYSRNLRISSYDSGFSFFLSCRIQAYRQNTGRIHFTGSSFCAMRCMRISFHNSSGSRFKLLRDDTAIFTLSSKVRNSEADSREITDKLNNVSKWTLRARRLHSYRVVKASYAGLKLSAVIESFAMRSNALPFKHEEIKCMRARSLLL